MMGTFIRKGLTNLKKNGLRDTLRKVLRVLFRYLPQMNPRRIPLPTKKEFTEQRNTVFSRDIKFSVITPLYNTPARFLIEMIDSVREQSYTNWELCLADGSDKARHSVLKICEEYARKDVRIKYVRLDKNEGISGNTNRAIELATGDYFALLDHDDVLHPSALFEVANAIEKNADFIYTDEAVFSKDPWKPHSYHYKSDFGIDTLRSYNYICHLCAFSRALLKKTGLFRPECDGSQDFDIILRLTEHAQKIVHIPKALYAWRAHSTSVASGIEAKPYTIAAAHIALADHLQRAGLNALVRDTPAPGGYKIEYEIQGNPMISIIIPNADATGMLKRCIESILKHSSYDNYEILIAENNSKTIEIFQYYDVLKKDPRIRVITWEKPFNFSAINNFAVEYAHGEYLIFLNNDITVITPEWIQEMLMFAQRADVGAVGAKLYYPNDTVQHAGVIIGIGGYAGHAFKGSLRGDMGYLSRLILAQDLSAVTAACMMIRKEVFFEINGFDETYKVAVNDVDICLRLREKGFLVVFTPFAELYHHESQTRGYEDTPEKKERYEREVAQFRMRWKTVLREGDPYYNPNLTLDEEDFTLKN